jgi:hypothetical protein
MCTIFSLFKIFKWILKFDYYINIHHFRISLPGLSSSDYITGKITFLDLSKNYLNFFKKRPLERPPTFWGKK